MHRYLQTGHCLTSKVLKKRLVGQCVLLHKTKTSTCEDKVRLFYAIKTTSIQTWVIRPFLIHKLSALLRSLILQYSMERSIITLRFLYYNIERSIITLRFIHYSMERSVITFRFIYYLMERSIPTLRLLHYSMERSIINLRFLHYAMERSIISLRFLHYSIERSIRTLTINSSQNIQKKTYYQYRLLPMSYLSMQSYLYVFDFWLMTSSPRL